MRMHSPLLPTMEFRSKVKIEFKLCLSQNLIHQNLAVAIVLLSPKPWTKEFNVKFNVKLPL